MYANIALFSGKQFTAAISDSKAKTRYSDKVLALPSSFGHLQTLSQGSLRGRLQAHGEYPLALAARAFYHSARWSAHGQALPGPAQRADRVVNAGRRPHQALAVVRQAALFVVVQLDSGARP